MVRYLPGEGWLTVVRSGVVVMVPGTTAGDVIDRLWAQLGENPNLQAILPVVAGGFGQGLESMPPFGVVSHSKRLHVLLRGEIRLAVVTGDGSDAVELSGEHVTTWTERIFDGGEHRFTLSAGPVAAGPAASALPLEAGVVRASAVSVGSFGGGAAPGPLDAEELATINPSLYLTSDGGAEKDGTGGDGAAGDGTDGAPAATGEALTRDRNEQTEQDPELQTTGYDHLWDQTVVRRVEDAAVRPPGDDDLPGAAAAETPAEAEHREPAHTPAAETGDAGPAAAPPSSASTEPTPVPVSAPGELIDSVPWARKSPETGQTAAPNVPAPVPSVPVPPPGQGQAAPDSDDHDGQTVMRSDLNSPPPRVQPSSEARPGTGPLVLARLCGQGHANPPEAPDCGVCAQPLDGDPREVPRPSLGTVRISTGEVVELDQSLIIGRQPSVSRVQGRGMPKLVQVTSAGGDISRSHVEVRLDGWHVLLCDLKATNGTVLIRPGQPPRRLGEGETAFLLDGDVAQLGDDVFLRFEGLR